MSEPSDNARLAKQVVIVLGALTLFAFFGFVVVPGMAGEGRVKPTLASGARSAASAEGWLDAADAPARKGGVIPPLDPSEVMTSNPKLLERGKGLYVKNCVPCHGETGKGDGPSATTLSSRPKDFTAQEGWKNGSAITGIYKTLTEGIKATSMTAYDYLPPKDRMALVHFVRSLGSFEHGAPDAAAEATLAAGFKTAGGMAPNRIPVSSAIWKLHEEFSPARPLIAPADGDPGAALFERAITDPRRAAQVLAARPEWRTDLGALARTCTAGAPGNGFSTRVATLAPQEWQTLQAVLVQAAGP